MNEALSLLTHQTNHELDKLTHLCLLIGVIFITTDHWNTCVKDMNQSWACCHQLYSCSLHRTKSHHKVSFGGPKTWQCKTIYKCGIPQASVTAVGNPWLLHCARRKNDHPASISVGCSRFPGLYIKINLTHELFGGCVSLLKYVAHTIHNKDKSIRAFSFL